MNTGLLRWKDCKNLLGVDIDHIDVPKRKSSLTGRLNFVKAIVGEQLIVDSRPGAKTIVDQFGNNLFQYFKKGTEFWPLLEGSNEISIQMDNSDANSEVSLVYTPRYLTW